MSTHLILRPLQDAERQHDVFESARKELFATILECPDATGCQQHTLTHMMIAYVFCRMHSRILKRGVDSV